MVASEMCLKLPEPSRRKEQGLNHESQVGSQLQDRASLHSAWSPSTPQSVTQVTAKPTHLFSPESLEVFPVGEHTFPLLYAHSSGKGRALA